MRYYWATTLYFLFFAGLIAVLFESQIFWAFEQFSAVPLIVAAVFMAAQTAFYILLPRYLPDQKAYLTAHPDRYYLEVNWRRLISKSADIFAQQVFIIVLVVSLHAMGLSLVQLVGWFFVLFSLLHIPLIATEWGRWPSWVFAGAVVSFSIVFPPLILLIPYGFVYTFVLHWIFYTVMAVVFWIQYE